MNKTVLLLVVLLLGLGLFFASDIEAPAYADEPGPYGAPFNPPEPIDTPTPHIEMRGTPDIGWGCATECEYYVLDDGNVAVSHYEDKFEYTSIYVPSYQGSLFGLHEHTFSDTHICDIRGYSDFMLAEKCGVDGGVFVLNATHETVDYYDYYRLMSGPSQVCGWNAILAFVNWDEADYFLEYHLLENGRIRELDQIDVNQRYYFNASCGIELETVSEILSSDLTHFPVEITFTYPDYSHTLMLVSDEVLMEAYADGRDIFYVIRGNLGDYVKKNHQNYFFEQGVFVESIDPSGVIFGYRLPNEPVVFVTDRLDPDGEWYEVVMTSPTDAVMLELVEADHHQFTLLMRRESEYHPGGEYTLYKFDR